MSRGLSFSITGDFVTRTAREWFWYEHKPWAVVQEFLLSCMCGTDMSEEELIDLARKVVNGQAKFIGNTADDSYAMVDDNKDLPSECRDYWTQKIENLEQELHDVRKQFFDLVDTINDKGYGWLIEMPDLFDDKDDDLDGSFAPNALLDSYLEQTRLEDKGFTDNYGWLEPNGTFHPVEWGEHQGWAHHKVLELGFLGEDEDTWTDTSCTVHYRWTGEEGDILVDRGWVLLHSPSLGIAQVTQNDVKPLTKAQKDFLFGYYADRGKHDLAQKYLEE